MPTSFRFPADPAASSDDPDGPSPRPPSVVRVASSVVRVPAPAEPPGTAAGSCRAVRPPEQYGHFALPGLPLRACRLVEKTSSKGKPNARVLGVNDLVIFLASTEGQRVHRLVLLEKIVAARVQQAEDSQLVHLKMDPEASEPDLLIRQTQSLDGEEGGGRDLALLLSDLRKQTPVGEGFEVEDVPADADLFAELRREKRMRKGKSYATPKQKVREGVLKQPVKLLAAREEPAPDAPPGPTAAAATPGGDPLPHPAAEGGAEGGASDPRRSVGGAPSDAARSHHSAAPAAAPAPSDPSRTVQSGWRSVTSRPSGERAATTAQPLWALHHAAGPGTTPQVSGAWATPQDAAGVSALATFGAGDGSEPPSRHHTAAQATSSGSDLPPRHATDGGPPHPLPGCATYVVELAGPDEPLGVQLGGGAAGVTIRDRTPGGACDRAGVPVGVLRRCAGDPVASAADVAAAMRRVRDSGLWAAFPVDVEPADAALRTFTSAGSAAGPPPPPAAAAGAAARGLFVGVSYADSPYELPDAPADAAAVHAALEARGALAAGDARLLLETPGAAADDVPTRANLRRGLDWLVAAPPPGATLYLVFVGHSMSLKRHVSGWQARDGPDEAVYPSDFMTKGVVQERDIMRVLQRAPPTCRVVMLSDCCGAGTMVDLRHKMKARADGSLLLCGGGDGGGASPISGPPMALVSCCRDEDTVVDAAGSGALARATAAALRAGPEPPAAELLAAARRALVAEVGDACPVPMLSATEPVDAERAPVGFLPAADPEPALSPARLSAIAGTERTASTPAVAPAPGGGGAGAPPMAAACVDDGAPPPAEPQWGGQHRTSSSVAADPHPAAQSEHFQPHPQHDHHHHRHNQHQQHHQQQHHQQPQPQNQHEHPQPQPHDRLHHSHQPDAHPHPHHPYPHQHDQHHQQSHRGQHSQPYDPQLFDPAHGPPDEHAATPMANPLVVPSPAQSAPLGAAAGDTGAQDVGLGVGIGPGLPALRPEDLVARMPHILASRGFEKTLAVRRHNGVPELFFAEAAAVLERGDGDGPLGPTPRYVLLGRQALYVVEPSGDVDRCIPLCDVQDFVLLNPGSRVDPKGTDGGPYILPGASNAPWLGARVPSQYELLLQPRPRAGSSVAAAVQELLQAVNVLLQQAAGAEPARVLVVERDAAPGLLRLTRPDEFSYPWAPLAVRIWPADARSPAPRRGAPP